MENGGKQSSSNASASGAGDSGHSSLSVSGAGSVQVPHEKSSHGTGLHLSLSSQSSSGSSSPRRASQTTSLLSPSSAQSAGPVPREKTKQGQLEQAMRMLASRYDVDLPGLHEAVRAYVHATRELTKAGIQLSEELSRVGGFQLNDIGDSWGRLGTGLRDVEATHKSFADDADRGYSAGVSSFEEDRRMYHAVCKDIRNHFSKFDRDLEAAIQRLERDRLKGTEVVVDNANRICDLVAEFDDEITNYSKKLHSNHQRQYVQLCGAVHSLVSTQSKYHEKMAIDLAALRQHWTTAEAHVLEATSGSLQKMRVASSGSSNASAISASGGVSASTPADDLKSPK